MTVFFWETLYKYYDYLRHWYDVLHRPGVHSRKAWKMARLRVSRSVHPDQEENLRMSGKLQVFTDIRIDDGTRNMVEATLTAFIEGHVERCYINLTRVPDTIDISLLAAAVIKVGNSQIIGGKAAQLEAILAAVLVAEDLALKSLDMSHGQSSQVPEDTMAGAVVKLNAFEGNLTAA